MQDLIGNFCLIRFEAFQGLHFVELKFELERARHGFTVRNLIPHDVSVFFVLRDPVFLVAVKIVEKLLQRGFKAGLHGFEFGDDVINRFIAYSESAHETCSFSQTCPFCRFALTEQRIESFGRKDLLSPQIQQFLWWQLAVYAQSNITVARGFFLTAPAPHFQMDKGGPMDEFHVLSP